MKGSRQHVRGSNLPHSWALASQGVYSRYWRSVVVFAVACRFWRGRNLRTKRRSPHLKAIPNRMGFQSSEGELTIRSLDPLYSLGKGSVTLEG